jgi:hypothetical protein
MKPTTSKYRVEDFVGADSLLNLNGTTQYIEIDNISLVDANVDFNGSDAHSYEIVFSIANTTNVGTQSRRLFNRGTSSNTQGGINFGVNNANRFFCQVITESSTTATTVIALKTLTLNTLYHVTVVINEVVIYINGQIEHTGTVANLSSRNLGKGLPLFIGRFIGFSTTVFTPMKIGVLRTYTKALTANEVLMQSKDPMWAIPSLTVNAVDLFEVKKDYVLIRI